MIARTTARLAVLSLLLVAPRPVMAQIVEYYHLDALGSVRAVTDAAGQVIERHDYLPFGEEWNPGSTPGQPRRFTGKERDEGTGLDYFGARYLAGTRGRFTTVDPIQTLDENLTDPQRWNRYAYARNNPYRWVDPDGRAIETPSDALNVAIGVVSLVGNVRSGNWGSAALDLAGTIYDVGATAIPGLPGGASMAIRASRAANKAADALNAAEAASKGRSFIVTKAGEAIPIPRGASGPIPAQTGRGFRFEGGTGGGPGLHGNVTGVRIMDPTKPLGPSPGYPGGYVTYTNGRQAVSPTTGQPLSRSDPQRHMPLKPRQER